MKLSVLYIVTFLSLVCRAQMKVDSLFASLDTIKSIDKKLGKLEKLAEKKKFKARDLTDILLWIESNAAKTKDKTDKLAWQRGKGNVLFYQEKYNDALPEYFKLLKTAEAENNELYCGIANKDIGETYDAIDNRPYAIKHFYFGMKHLEKLKNDVELGNLYNALGTTFKDQQKYDSALKYHERSLQAKMRTNNEAGIAYSYNNIALVYKRLKDFDKAEMYLKKSLEIKRKLKDKKGIAGSIINLANLYMNQSKNKESLELFLEGSNLAYEAKAGEFYRNGLDGLAKIYYQLKDYKNSARYFRKSAAVADSLKQEATKKQITELTAQYESEKKDAEISLQQEQLKSQLAENTKQRILIIASVIALLMALTAVFFVYRSYRQNKRNAFILAAKNHVIEEKNKEITDSINYAKHIQQSLLASKDMLDRNLESYFILYKPKDIVSGDFYWASETPKGFLVACVDCTGHGVPGAFMSLIGKENLDKALAKTVNPGEILRELNINVKRSLNQNAGSGNKDGMDAAVLRIEKDGNGNAEVTYAGANRPLYVLKKSTDTLEEIKATKQAVGGFTSNEQVFEEHKIRVSKGDTLVITTDGYADQFGSESNKKLTTKRFKDLLVSVKAKHAAEQKQTLEEFFTIWKGHREQLDDLLVIGINI